MPRCKIPQGPLLLVLFATVSPPLATRVALYLPSTVSNNAAALPLRRCFLCGKKRRDDPPYYAYSRKYVPEQ